MSSSHKDSSEECADTVLYEKLFHHFRETRNSSLDMVRPNLSHNTVLAVMNVAILAIVGEWVFMKYFR